MELCRLCKIKPATLTVTVFYKMHKLYRTSDVPVCCLHQYTDSLLDECDFCYEGEYVEIDGQIWWWPVDEDGRLMRKICVTEIGHHERCDSPLEHEGKWQKRFQLQDEDFQNILPDAYWNLTPQQWKEWFLTLDPESKNIYRRVVTSRVDLKDRYHELDQIQLNWSK